jgi:hypothetical protein
LACGVELLRFRLLRGSSHDPLGDAEKTKTSKNHSLTVAARLTTTATTNNNYCDYSNDNHSIIINNVDAF